MKRLWSLLLLLPAGALLACEAPQSPEAPSGRAGVGPGGGGPSASQCDVTVDDDAGETIQGAIDGASSGDVICVKPGSYAENLTVDKAVTVRGLTDPLGSSPASVDGQATITAPEVKLSQLKFSPTFESGVPDAAILVSGSQADRVVVKKNLVADATISSSRSRTVNGIQLWNPDTENVQSDATVMANTVRGLTHPKVAGVAGIKAQGVVEDAEILRNEVRDLHSAGWVWGVSMTHTGNDPSGTSPKDVTVRYNTLADLNNGSEFQVSGSGAPYPGAGFGVDDTFDPDGPGGAAADEATAQFNSFLAVPFGVVNKDQTEILDAKCNYWGHASGPSNAANDADKGATAVGKVDFKPWSVRKIGRGANPEKSCVGGQQDTGS